MIEYSQHALERMEQRKYPKEWIELCLDMPDRIVPDPKHSDRIQKLRCIPGHGHMLKVVVPKERAEFVITVYFDRKFPCHHE